METALPNRLLGRKYLKVGIFASEEQIFCYSLIALVIDSGIAHGGACNKFLLEARYEQY